jgi:hypothetical protein
MNLSETDKSLLFSNLDEGNLLSELFGLKVSSFDDFQVELEKYKDFEVDTINAIKSDKVFKAMPKNKLNCDFCHLNLYCEKGAS